MIDLRCTRCNHLLGRRMQISYGEIKCPHCGMVNTIDYREVLTDRVEYDRLVNRYDRDSKKLNKRASPRQIVRE